MGPEALDRAVDPDAPREIPNLSYIRALDGIRGAANFVIMVATVASS